MTNAEKSQARISALGGLLILTLLIPWALGCGANGGDGSADGSTDAQAAGDEATSMARAQEGSPGSSTAAVPPATSINAIMVGLVDHAAHNLWDLGRDGMAPETDRDWLEVTHHAIQIIAAGPAITAGGTGANDEMWVGEEAWRQYTRDMMDAGVAALEAAEQRDLDGVLSAGDDLIMSCEGCHADYKPDLPTEGIVHPHYYELQ